MPKILLVDDDVTQLKLTRLRLADAGYEVATATGGVEALELARRQRPDAIVSDVLMGELDGFGFCRLVRGEASLAEVPIILLSAHYRGEPDQDLALRVGASALLARTADFDVELAALRDSLGNGPRPAACEVGVAVYEQHLRTNATQLTRLLGKARSAEERSRTLFETASDVISVIGDDGVVVEANPRWLDVLGIPPDEAIGRHICDFAAPGHEAANLEQFQHSMRHRTGRTEAVALSRRDGTTVLIEFSFSRVELDGREHVITIGRDVTERVMAARQLAAAEERYRTLVERIPDVIWSATADARITFITPNVEQVLGFTAEEVCSAPRDEATADIHRDDRATVLQSYASYVAGGAPFDLEYRRQRKDGEWIWVRDRAIATYARDGVRHLDGILSDITGRRRLEQHLAQAQKMEAIGELTGGVAHDFNNILAAIMASAEFLIEDLAEHDPRRDDAEEIKRSTERAAALTRQLLAFSRRQALAPSLTDLDTIVRDLERMLRRLIAEDITFTVRPGADLGVVRVDVGQLEQVIMNLVVNARDAMPAGGMLTITTSNEGPYVRLAVSDTGCGMDAETQRRVFEPFFTTKEVGKGTGLGLSTCYGIVKQSGGHIQISSAVGQGSTFAIYLPRVDRHPAVLNVEAAVPPALGGRETVLLVEDDPRVRMAVGRMLRNRGYHVIAAGDGDEAVAAADMHTATIDLVLTDVVMPGASGPEVVHRVRRANPTVRALFMSGYNEHPALQGEDLRDGLHFLQKPFTPDALARKLREVLDG